MYKRLFTLFISLTLCVGTAWSSDFEDAEIARNNGNFKLAIQKFTAAALDGNYFGIMQLGLMHDAAQGSDKDFNESYNLIKNNAIKGSAYAQMLMASMAIDGTLFRKNCSDGVHWYKMSASNGNRVAQNNLGGLYLDGECVPKNYLFAYMWRSLSLAQSDVQLNRDTLEGYPANKMTKEQVAEAQRMARICFNNNYKNCD